MSRDRKKEDQHHLLPILSGKHSKVRPLHTCAVRRFDKTLRIEMDTARKIMGLLEKGTLPETNIAPENGWLESYFPIGMAYFQVLC